MSPKRAAKPDGLPLEAELAQTRCLACHCRMLISRDPQASGVALHWEGTASGPPSTTRPGEEEE